MIRISLILIGLFEVLYRVIGTLLTIQISDQLNSNERETFLWQKRMNKVKSIASKGRVDKVKKL